MIGIKYLVAIIILFFILGSMQSLWDLINIFQPRPLAVKAQRVLATNHQGIPGSNYCVIIKFSSSTGL